MSRFSFLVTYHISDWIPCMIRPRVLAILLLASLGKNEGLHSKTIYIR
jgi:hypothetical protein